MQDIGLVSSQVNSISSFSLHSSGCCVNGVVNGRALSY